MPAAGCGIDVDDVRADNPAVVYVRATAFGARGPDAERGGYDAGAYWARSGMQHVLTPPGAAWPRPAPPAFGDVVGALAIVGAVGAALYRRATGGEPAVIDASLLASGMWQLQPEIVSSAMAEAGDPEATPADRYRSWNPLMLTYRTADGRYVALTMLASDRHWRGLLPGDRPPRDGGRSPLRRPGRPGPQRPRLRRVARRGLRPAGPRRLATGARRLPGRMGAGAAARPSCTTTRRCRPTATSPRSTSATGGPLPMVADAGPVRRAARPADPRPRARRAHRGRAARAGPVVGRDRRRSRPAAPSSDRPAVGPGHGPDPARVPALRQVAAPSRARPARGTAPPAAGRPGGSAHLASRAGRSCVATATGSSSR